MNFAARSAHRVQGSFADETWWSSALTISRSYPPLMRCPDGFDSSQSKVSASSAEATEEPSLT